MKFNKSDVIKQSNKSIELLKQAIKLQSIGDTAKALELSQQLCQTSFDKAVEYSTLGRLLSIQQQYNESLTSFEKALSLEPNNPNLLYSIATVQRYLGKFELAEANCDAAIKLNNRDHEAQLLRSNLRKQTSSSNHINELTTLLQQDIPLYPMRAQINYALAKEYEDLKQNTLSFKHLKAGADIRRRHMKYNIESDEQAMSQILMHHDQALIESDIKGFDSDEPIFIVGLPRTGSTLVERILSSHSSVMSIGETNNFAHQMIKLVNEHTCSERLNKAGLIKASTSLDFNKLGAAYIESTRPLTGNTDYFIDKLPINFLYIGLISLAFPKAKIIHTTRNPMDTCYSIYKRYFNEAYPFSYNLNDLGRYYLKYKQLMEHWQTILPDRIYTLSYESLVTDTEKETNLLLQYCNLPWEDECMFFHKNDHATTTASAEQVRQPVYNSSINQWRNFEIELETLSNFFKQAGLYC